MNTDPNILERVKRLEPEMRSLWETLVERDLPLAVIVEDLEHPEKLKAEAQAGLDHFMHCFCTYHIFKGNNELGTNLIEKLPIVEAYLEACCQLAGLFRRMDMAGLEYSELGYQYKQVIYEYSPDLQVSK